MVLENFDGGRVNASKAMGTNEWKSSTEEQDSSSLTSQFSCLKSKRINQSLPNVGKVSVKGEKSQEEGGAPLKSNRAEKEKNFSVFSIIWIILPIINLFAEIAMDLIGIILFFVKEIFKVTYDMMVPPVLNIFGNEGSRAGKKHCFKLGWVRNLTLVLCPPAAIFLATGLKGWLQIIICCLATLLYYFPGLAYAIIVIGRSEVNSYMKKTQEGNTCDDDGLFDNFYISDKDNQPKCSRKAGETCSAEGEDLGGGRLDCCAQPELIDGIWKQAGSDALDPDGNPITEYSQAELRCANDTKKIKMPKGICVFKSTNSP